MAVNLDELVAAMSAAAKVDHPPEAIEALIDAGIAVADAAEQGVVCGHDMAGLMFERCGRPETALIHLQPRILAFHDFIPVVVVPVVRNTE